MKYTNYQLETMRNMMAQHEAETISDEDVVQILLEGCIGWQNFTDEEVIEAFEDEYGEDYFETMNEKDHKNGLYGETI